MIRRVELEIEELDEGYVVGAVNGGVKRRLATQETIAVKAGLVVADVLAAGVPESTPVGSSGVGQQTTKPAAAASQPTSAPPPPKEPPAEAPKEGPKEPVALSQADEQRFDAMARAIRDGKLVVAEDASAPGFYSGDLAAAVPDVFPSKDKASAFLSNAFAAEKVERGFRDDKGYRYWPKVPIARAAAPAAAEIATGPTVPKDAPTGTQGSLLPAGGGGTLAAAPVEPPF